MMSEDAGLETATTKRRAYRRRHRPEGLGARLPASARDMLELLRGRIEEEEHGGAAPVAREVTATLVELGNHIGVHHETLRYAQGLLARAGYLEVREVVAPTSGTKGKPRVFGYRVTSHGWSYQRGVQTRVSADQAVAS
ncbi:MAG: hypothetical protein KAY22_02275 [Rhizorhabdus sp.]|uniref:hypothetical protein n=1 Tax=Rhizorhabdus sp. TaxID=1968843 RepID=UPI001B74F80C|nr:hypothetical protein [Rhizorhabdus sp.]MBP8231107.1 hypothetical protein [Rhizorhabdus sp.]